MMAGRPFPLARAAGSTVFGLLVGALRLFGVLPLFVKIIALVVAVYWLINN